MLEKLFQQIDVKTPSPEFSDHLDKKLQQITSNKQITSRKQITPHQNKLIWIVLSGVAAAVLLSLFLFSREKPWIITLAPIQESMDEKRQCLSYLVDTSDMILNGRIYKSNGKFVCDVMEVLKGESPKKNPKFEEITTIRCPEPPAFKTDLWVVLFMYQGQVPTDQWKAEFVLKEDMVRFSDRVRLYLDKEAALAVALDLKNNNKTLPYSDPDRLLMDLWKFKDPRSIPDLILFVKALKADPYDLKCAIRILGEFKDKRVSGFFMQIHNKRTWPKFLKDEVKKLLPPIKKRLEELGYLK